MPQQTINEYERKMGRLKAERDMARAEIARLEAQLAKPAVKPRKAKTPKRKKITMRQITGLGGAFAVRAGMVDLDIRDLYLAATKKTAVPAHDPAFGRLGA